MRDGLIEQVAPPLDVYARPANTFVARFIGAPPMNLVPAALVGVAAPSGAVAGIRPQDVSVGPHGLLRGVVELVEPRGHDHLLHLRIDSPGAGLPFLAVAAVTATPPVGAEIFVAFPADRLHLFDGGNGTRL
jgi:ABC-type sugar transport system ATPase subunit